MGGKQKKGMLSLYPTSRRPWSCFPINLGYFEETERSQWMCEELKEQKRRKRKGRRKARDEIRSKTQTLVFDSRWHTGMPTQNRGTNKQNCDWGTIMRAQRKYKKIKIKNKKKKREEKKNTEVLAEPKRLKDQVNLQRKDRSFFCMLLDIFTLIGPDIAPRLYQGSQKHTLRDWVVWSYSGEGKKEDRKQKKKEEKKKHAGCGNVLWQQTSTVSAVAAVISAPWWRSSQWCWGLKGSRVRASKSGKRGGRTPKVKSIYRPVTRSESELATC